jgi:phosphatidylserine/phosphatidylglycerophosphate/cardiolipin synthase-like enzyme
VSKAKSLIQNLQKRGLSEAAAKRIVIAALTSGALREVRSAPSFEQTEVSGVIPQEVLLEEIYHHLSEGIVATAPVVIPNTRPTLEVFQLIIAAAKNELLISSPYIDDEGVRHLTQPFVAATERNVKMYLLTRETQRRDPGRTSGIRRLNALTSGTLEVRDYYTSVDSRHITAVHAKVLLADDVIGYVGSAEIRQHGLLSNFEMGYIFHKGEAALAARQAFQAFWEIASRVDIEHL